MRRLGVARAARAGAAKQLRDDPSLRKARNQARKAVDSAAKKKASKKPGA